MDDFAIYQPSLMKPTQGGARKGAGRPPGSSKGRTVKSSSITLTPALWGKLDALRGELTRSAWIAGKISDSDFNACTRNGIA